MSPLAEEYRRRVKVAEAMAEATQDRTAKEAYLEVAERRRRLAKAIAACRDDAKRGVRLGRDIGGRGGRPSGVAAASFFW
jgi:hypothetical protein